MNQKALVFTKYINRGSLAIMAILSIGLAARLYRLGANDLWYDEIVSFVFASDFKFSDIIYYDFHPPLYYFLLMYWIKIFGVSEFMLRLPSAILSAAAILIIYKIGKTIFNRKVGILSALIFALSPFQIWYAQEARSYAMSLFLISLATLFLAQILYKDKRHLWKYFIVCALLCILTEYITLLILASFTILILLDRRDLFKKWLSSWAIVFLGFSPWIYYLWIQITNLINIEFWIPNPTIFSFFATIKNFSLGYESKFAIPISILFIFSMLFGISRLLRYKSKLVFMIAPIFVTIITVVMVSKFLYNSIYLDRQLISISLFYYLLVTTCILMANNRITKMLFISLIIMFNIFALKEYYTEIVPNSKKPFKPLAKFINSYRDESDIIITGAHMAVKPLRYYYLKNMQYYFLQKDTAHSYLMKFPKVGKPYEIVGSFEDIVRGQKVKRVWLVTGSWERDGRQDGSSKLAIALMSNYGTLLKSKVFDGFYVNLFSLNSGDIHEN